jgi:hypothetical protein
MTIQVYPYNKQEEKALLDFLESRHYNYKSDDKEETSSYEWSEDVEFVAELDERVRRYEDGLDRGYTLAELETSIEELKKKRAGK